MNTVLYRSFEAPQNDSSYQRPLSADRYQAGFPSPASHYAGRNWISTVTALAGHPQRSSARQR